MRTRASALALESRGYWLAEDVLALPASPQLQADARLLLHSSAAASLSLEAGTVVGSDRPPLQLVHEPAGLPAALRSSFPHLSSYACLRLPRCSREDKLRLLKSQLLLSADGPDSVRVTGVQTAGAVDALCAYDGPLGV